VEGVVGRDSRPADNPALPAGYTYLAQFVDHDITFDPTSRLDRVDDAEAVRNFRTPRFDLDSIYGGGPKASPYLYNKNDQALLRIDRAPAGTTSGSSCTTCSPGSSGRRPSRRS
jgi:hypothetical protein